MKSSSLVIAVSLAILLNAGFSMLQYRRYVQLELDEDSFAMPADVSFDLLTTPDRSLSKRWSACS